MTTPESPVTPGNDAAKPRPTLPQLIRIRRRIEKAHEAIEQARYYLSEAIGVYDVDAPGALQIKHDSLIGAMYDAEHARNILDAAGSLLAGAQDGVTEQKKREKRLISGGAP